MQTIKYGGDDARRRCWQCCVVLMTKHHQPWRLNVLPGHVKWHIADGQSLCLILISIVFTHDDRMKHVRSVIIKAARAKTKRNFCPAHAATEKKPTCWALSLSPGSFRCPSTIHDRRRSPHAETHTSWNRHAHQSWLTSWGPDQEEEQQQQSKKGVRNT